MGKAYQKKVRGPKKRTGWMKAEGSCRVLQLLLDRVELVQQIQQGLHNFAVELGLKLAANLLQDEVESLCGKPHERMEGRQGSRHGHQAGVITIAGQKLPIERPRVRGPRGELGLANYGLLQREGAMPEAVLRRMVRGVSCRDYASVIELGREGFGVERSSVSRAFVEASRREVQALMERRFEGKRFAVLFIDGVEYGGETLIVVLGVDLDGRKQILGLRQGGTENLEVCTSLLEELCERGLSRQDPMLFVLDGSKALGAAVSRIWGRYAIVQRCQVHKKRNVKRHLAKRHWPEVIRRLNAAYHESDHEKALRSLKTTVAWLERISPDAAASLREGLEETLTVVGLGLPADLKIHLNTTNPIESALSVTRRLTRRVTRWREGNMRQRWCAAGLLQAEQKFRRLKGYRYLSQLVAKLDSLGGNKQTLPKSA